MIRQARRASSFVLVVAVSAFAVPASAWELAGNKTIALHTREGQAVPIGSVEFRPEGGRVRFAIKLDHARFKDYFLSMREFKCIDGPGETHCHVPYPYRMPSTVTAGDLAWLEHSLLFLHNTPRDYGAKLAKGVYYRMQITADGIVGTPQSVDLAQIGAPPADLDVPPFGPADRGEIGSGERWFSGISIR
ncbi:MAG: hypothetical protein E6R11_06365 [Rhodocyclaceae bacterium]|jgi:hypothetical protein|nr:MAG: hypothetical protein E6R11_06365 [Rhodocyclaceae bacterium]